MIIKVLDKAYTPIGVLENIKSCQYKRNWSTCSEFVVEMDGVSELLLVDNVLVIEGKYGIIEQLTITADEGGEHTQVRGRGLLSLLSRRIVAAKWSFSGLVPDAMTDIIASNLRGLAFAPTVLTDGVVDETTGDYTCDLGTNLMDKVENLATAARLGFAESIVDGIPTIALRKGQTRQGWFATENGTLLTKEYDHSKSTLKNVCYASNGSQESPVTVTVGDASGNDRYEHYLSEPVETDDEGNARTEEEQIAMLITKGKEALSDLSEVESLASTINPYGQMEYKVDYDLGDYIVVKAPTWGVAFTPHITSIKEVWDQSGFTLEVSFGSTYLTLRQRIKKGVD